MSRRFGSSRKTKSPSSSSSCKSRNSGKSIKDQVINEKMKLAKLQALASFRKQQKTKKLEVEEMKLEEELVKRKAGVKVIEAQEELDKGKFLDSGLNSDYQIGLTENSSFRDRTVNNIQSIKQNMNVLQHSNKKCARLKASDISETFAKASLSHCAAVHNLSNDNNRFIGARITDSRTKITIRSREDGERKGVSEIIYKLLQYQGDPEVEIDKFNGNPLEYQYSVSMFNQVLEMKVSDQTRRLTRLLKFTGGEAKELIKHCIHLPPKTGYETAKQQLWKSSLFACIMQERKKALPSVKSGDASGFRKFYSFVLKCETYSKSTAWNALGTPETLCILALKLPGSLRDIWNRKLQVVRRNCGREPYLSDFASFVHEEANLVNDPFFSKDTVLKYVETPEKKRDKKNMEFLPQKEEKW